MESIVDTPAVSAEGNDGKVRSDSATLWSSTIGLREEILVPAVDAAVDNDDNDDDDDRLSRDDGTFGSAAACS